MTALAGLDALALAESIRVFKDALRSHQSEINRLNVYPVPDGDTGTNMTLTLESVVARLDELPQDLNGADAQATAQDLEAVCHAISHGSLMGARGNSGVILSQIMRGFTNEFRRKADLTDDDDSNEATLAGSIDRGALQLARSMIAASKAAYQAVMRPVEGTILTVVRESSEAGLEAALGGATLIDTINAARQSGAESLERTPTLLPVLAQAGVVDAGGRGFLLFLDALRHVVDGSPMPEAPANDDVLPLAMLLEEALVGEHDSVSDLRYEVMYFLEAPDELVPAFKEVWATLGDSIVVVGGDGLWNCHIHTDDIGAAIEAAIDCGRPREIRVTDLFEQMEEERWVREAAQSMPPNEPPEPVGTAVVTVAAGGGLHRLFGALGVQQIVAGGQSMNPSTAELVAAVEAAPSDEVVILPNNKNIVAVANQVVEATQKTVYVVPTHAVTEGMAALLAYDPESDAETNSVEMARAAADIVTGEVTQAVRESSSEAGPIALGDFIGVTNDGIWSVSKDLTETSVGLLKHLISNDYEIVTILEGDGSRAGITRAITEWLNDNYPDLSVEVHHGGQPLYPYIFGLE
ncbi:MAG: DAK2 domain-containing protein [Acidimicrobiia bacterium]